MQKYLFTVEYAQKYGVNEAIILENIIHWLKYKKANGIDYYDGRYWLYYSIKNLQSLYPFFTYKQVRYALDNLVEKGALLKGNYNKCKYDKTNWFALTDETILNIPDNEENKGKFYTYDAEYMQKEKNNMLIQFSNPYIPQYPYAKIDTDKEKIMTKSLTRSDKIGKDENLTQSIDILEDFCENDEKAQPNLALREKESGQPIPYINSNINNEFTNINTNINLNSKNLNLNKEKKIKKEKDLNNNKDLNYNENLNLTKEEKKNNEFNKELNNKEFTNPSLSSCQNNEFNKELSNNKEIVNNKEINNKDNKKNKEKFYMDKYFGKISEKEYLELFNKFWKEYPRKEGKVLALKNFAYVLKESGFLGLMIALQNYIRILKENNIELTYTIKGSNFIGNKLGGRYLDYIAEVTDFDIMFPEFGFYIGVVTKKQLLEIFTKDELINIYEDYKKKNEEITFNNVYYFIQHLYWEKEMKSERKMKEKDKKND